MPASSVRTPASLVSCIPAPEGRARPRARSSPTSRRRWRRSTAGRPTMRRGCLLIPAARAPQRQRFATGARRSLSAILPYGVAWRIGQGGTSSNRKDAQRSHPDVFRGWQLRRIFQLQRERRRKQRRLRAGSRRSGLRAAEAFVRGVRRRARAAAGAADDGRRSRPGVARLHGARRDGAPVVWLRSDLSRPPVPGARSSSSPIRSRTTTCSCFAR